MKVRHAQNFWSGILFLSFGLLGMWLSRAYATGTASEMGPGYFPAVLSGLLVAVGLFIAIAAIVSTTDGGSIPATDFRIILWVTGSIVMFGVLLTYLGLFIACFGVIFFASMASDEHSYKVAALSGLVLATTSVAMFVWGLRLQFEVWPPFLIQ